MAKCDSSPEGKFIYSIFTTIKLVGAHPQRIITIVIIVDYFTIVIVVDGMFFNQQTQRGFPPF